MRWATVGETAPERPEGAPKASSLTTAVSRRPVSSLADCREADTAVRDGGAPGLAEPVEPTTPGAAASRRVDADRLARDGPFPLGRDGPFPLGRAAPLRCTSWGRPVAGNGRGAGGDFDAGPRRPGVGGTDS
jgi:hypothetical protein